MVRLKTEIKNLDTILYGSILFYSFNIVSGVLGIGKTIFVQILYNFFMLFYILKQLFHIHLKYLL